MFLIPHMKHNAILIPYNPIPVNDIYHPQHPNPASTDLKNPDPLRTFTLHATRVNIASIVCHSPPPPPGTVSLYFQYIPDTNIKKLENITFLLYNIISDTIL